MAPPALRIPLSVPMDQFQRDMDKARSITSHATQQIVQQFVKMNSTIATDLRVNTALFSGMVAAGRNLLPLAGSVLAIAAAFKIMTAITELGKEKIAEFIAIADKASAAGVGTEFFQRATVAAKSFNVAAEDVSKAMEKLKSDMEDTLGGSGFSKRMKELTEAGNFGDNAGVKAIGAANNPEERWRAVVKLITEAMQAGERLAALDLAERFLPPKMLERLRANGEALDEMQRKADAVAKTKIIDDATISQAIDLNRRLNEAHETLANKFKPVMDDLVKLGLSYHESWVRVVQQVASVVGWVTNLYVEMKKISELAPPWFVKYSAPLASALTSPGSVLANPIGWATKQYETLTAPAGSPMSPEMVAARAALAPGLKNPATIAAAQKGATDLMTKVRGDTSDEPGKAAAAAATAVKDAFDRAIDSVNKHAGAMLADAAAAGMTKTAQEQLRAELQLLEAARRAGTKISDEQVAAYARLRTEMGAEQALTRTGIALKDQDATAFQAASERIKAASDASVAAKAKFQQAADASKELGSALSDAFKGAVLEGKKFDEILKSLINRLATKGIDNLFNSVFGTPSAGGASSFLKMIGIGGGSLGTGGSMLAQPGTAGIPVFAGNAAGTDNWRGGPTWVGENGPEILNIPRGAQIVPNDVARSLGGGANISMGGTYVDARGSTLSPAEMKQIVNGAVRQSEQRIANAMPAIMARHQKLVA